MSNVVRHPVGANPASRVPRWRRLLRAAAVNFVWLAAVLVAVHLWQTRNMPSGDAPEFAAPAVSAQAGAELSLAQWRAAHPGQPVVLYFWAEWCPICRLEQPTITSLGQDWPVLTIASWSGDVPAVRRVLEQRSLRWATVVDQSGDVARQYGANSVPTFVILDAQGRIRSRSVGYTTGWGLRARLWWARF